MTDVTSSGLFRAIFVGQLAAFAALALFVSAASAAPPTNDNFDAATILAGDSGTLAGTTVEATREAGETALGGGRSVWYRFTATEAGSLRVSTCTAASFDTVLGVFTGAAVNALTIEGANDDACEDKSRLTVAVRPGSTYHIAVDGFGTTSGTFTLTWSFRRPPPNDAFAAAVPIAGPRGSVVGTNAGATTEPGEPVHGSTAVGATVWYAWTAPVTGGVMFDTCSGAAFDTVLVAYSGDSLTSLRFLAGSDDSCRTQSSIRFATRAGVTYHIAVAGFVAGTDGAFQLKWSGATAPRNDPFAAATRLGGRRGAAGANNLGASAEPGERSHARRPASASIWFRWRALRTERVSFQTCGSRFDTVLAVYRGTSVRRLRAVGSNDDAGGSCKDGSRVIFTARAGREYRIVVDSYGFSAGAVRLRWGKPSAAAQACRVPDVRGVTLPQAREAIKRAGCLLGRIRYVRSTRVAAGFVVAQRPRPGTRLAPPRRVELDISRGSR
ncbi:MAG TPA: PASTA domain-containing protein [Gaiellaceae bacterium]|nr:PASTA domain-containing protein [Gaiellaceae bacterium]HET8652619.1 PASTA domain-containing protein [Gaiellaceae bacterium]